jgi:hypothetical protein
MKTLALLAILTNLLLPIASTAATVIDFEDLTLSNSSFYNGGPDTNTDGWASGGAHFGNSYNSDFGGYWSGWSYSNINDTTTAGFENQYASFAGGGAGGSGNYAVAYGGSAAFINLPENTKLASALVTNTTYTALDILNGGGFSRKFKKGDKFSVIFTGYAEVDSKGSQTGSVLFDLADFTHFDEDTDNASDLILSNWTSVDLTALGLAKSLAISFLSTDVGDWGINTPTYIAMDNLTLTAVPEPNAILVLTMAGCVGMVVYRRNVAKAATVIS